MLDPAIAAQLDELQVRYVSALDEHDMRGWADCFAAEASYVCTTRESEEQNLPIALMLDDTRDRIEDRINHITKVWAGTYEDYSTRHVVQRLSCVQRLPDVFVVKSNFIVAYTTARGKSEMLAAGCYLDEVSLAGHAPRFTSKRAVLDSVITPRYLVYPV